MDVITNSTEAVNAETTLVRSFPYSITPTTTTKEKKRKEKVKRTSSGGRKVKAACERRVRVVVFTFGTRNRVGQVSSIVYFPLPCFVVAVDLSASM